MIKITKRIRLENYREKEDEEDDVDIYVEKSNDHYIKLTDRKKDNEIEIRPSEATALKKWLEDNDY